ncbi:MAG: hypothetical protein NTW50_01670, partial [Candidatus Berkelbacteria bacterium]|nr:hypothetical protein [Candidatus Berkelbacteria bacterium]
MNAEGKKFNCSRITESLSNLQFYDGVLKTYTEERNVTEARKTISLMGAEYSELLAEIDPFQIIRREQLAQKLEFDFVEPIQLNGLAVGKRDSEKSVCYLVDSVSEKVIPTYFINNRGEKIYSKPKVITKFVEGRALLYFELAGGNFFEMIDESGTPLTAMLVERYRKIYDFESQKFPIRVDNHLPSATNVSFSPTPEPKYKDTVYLDRNGKFIAENIHRQEFDIIVPDYNFHEGVAWSAHDEDEICLIDENGGTLFILDLKECVKVGAFYNGFALIVDRSSDRRQEVKFISRDGDSDDFVLPIKPDSLRSATPDEAGFYYAEDLAGFPIFFKPNGETLSGKKLGFVRAGDFDQYGFAPVKLQNENLYRRNVYTFLSTLGTYPFGNHRFSNPATFHDGIAVCLYTSGATDLIDTEGKVVKEFDENVII